MTDENAPEEGQSRRSNPTPEGSKTAVQDGENGAESPLADGVAKVAGEHYPPAIAERDVWVSWILDGAGRKRPVAPWQTGHAYPVEWSDDLEGAERPETDFETAKRWGDFPLDRLGVSLPDDAQSDQLETGVILPLDRPPREERFTLIDWDDVRDPETREIHPVAAAYIAEYGGFVEVSTSGKGLHQYVTGGLRKRGKFIAPIDDEPFVGDDLPQVEMYDGGRHVAMTGRHVAGTDRDAVEGQELIDEIIREYADAEKDAGHRRYDPDTGEAVEPAEDDAADTGGEVPDPNTGEYEGPALAELLDTKPDDRPLRYHSAVYAFYNGAGESTGYAGVLNWRLEGSAAAIGEQAGLSAADVKDDLDGAYLDDTEVEQKTAHRTPHRVEYAHDRAGDGRLGAPNRETLVEYGVLPPAVLEDTGDEAGYEQTDPRELFDDPVVVEPRDAWRAAGAVRPDDLDPDDGGRLVSLGVTDDRDAWATAEGRRVDGVVRAVALEEGLISDPTAELGAETFDEAYRRARRHYGAPLPEYVDETTATDQKWILYGALDQINHYHLDGIRSTVTDTGEGDVVAEINPSWEYSASGHRVLAFRSGWFYCREHDTSLDALRFVALEEGILDGCDDELEGEAFLEAVDALRDRGAPVPRYDGEIIDHEAVLPEADDLLEEFTTDADRLDAARLDVEAVVEEAAADTTQADLVTALPALGKTTNIVKNAARQSTLYAAPRKELQAEVLDKAEAYGVSAYTLPVLAENHIKRDAKAEGAAAVREVGQDLLRRRDELVERIESDIHPDPDAEAVAEDDEVDLDRATCSTANGAHGEGWQVVVQVAVELGFSPEAVHKRSKALFGEQIPCTCDEHEDDEASVECAYSKAWERVADPDRPVDLLVGSRTHAYVRSARTWYGRDGSDRVDVEPRAVAIDEFPDDAYGRRYGEEAPTIATWLATALREDLADHRDVLEAGLWDTWVRKWTRGSRSGDALPAFDHLDRRLEACRLLLNARDEIDDIQPADRPDAAEAFRAAVDRGVGRGADTADLYALVDAALASVREADTLPRHVASNLGALLGDLCAALGEVDGPIGEADLTVEGDRLGETLRDVFDTALEGALVDGADHALEAGRDVCRGGEAGTQALAVHADGPYAHPDAYLLLAGMVGDGEVVRTQQFRFDPTRPHTHLTRTRLDGATVLFDRDHDGAYVLDPPEFVDTAGRDCPVVGLDATGRETLWSLALGEDVRRRDIHDSARERRAFLRDVLNLQVVQTSAHVNSYSHVANKNFDGDVELVRSVAEEYRAGRLRADTLSTTTKPGVITTKKARARIEGRLEDDVDAIDHYGNVTGSNDLAECNIGVVLGSRHFSDAPVEKWAAIAGEEVTRTGHGADLSYGSDVAEEYLAHMREDQTMQSILRFGRDEEGALVFAHTSALAEDLPVVGDGAVVSAHSSGGVEVRNALLPYLERGRTFTVSDLVDDVDVGRRTVQRKLREFADLGYLKREEHGAGRASTFAPDADPGHGDVELPVIAGPGDRDPDSDTFTQYSTGIVGVRDTDLTARGPLLGTRALLPPPTTADTTVDGVEPPG